MSNLDKDLPQAQNVQVGDMTTIDLPAIAAVPSLSEYSNDFAQLQNPLMGLNQPIPLNILKGSRKHKFTPEEDETLKQLVAQFGQDWKTIASVLKNRSARQCRDRWKHYLSPEISRRPWTQDEDRLLIQKFRELGRQWAVIAKFFPERTDIHIKNRWATLAPKLGYANGIPEEDNMNKQQMQQIDVAQTAPDLLKIDPQ